MDKNSDPHFNILVFPCGSEIGLEIYRSLEFSRFVTLYGGNSIDDHGKFIFKNYIGEIPFYSDPEFIDVINNLINQYHIDAIYPTMDSVIAFLTKNTHLINAKIIASKNETNQICLSKLKTYAKLNGLINIPQIFTSFEDVDNFPVFMKPNVGYGSRGVAMIHDKLDAEFHLKHNTKKIILEYLPGKEITIDCFTDKHGELLFWGARDRSRIRNGISVNTKSFHDQKLKAIVETINDNIEFRGAWFIQLKEDKEGNPFLLEIAARLGGSSALYRAKGINFALLSVFDAFEMDIEVLTNDFSIELDRALENKYHLNINYNQIYVDFDDCLLIDDKLNDKLIQFLIQQINKKNKVILLTKHSREINDTLNEFRLGQFFDEIIQIEKNDDKSDFINPENAIFIDDSFMERKSVYEKLKIPVFAPDAIECLID